MRLRICETLDRRVAASGPVLVTVDDLPWVDADSVALCHYRCGALRSGGSRWRWSSPPAAVQRLSRSARRSRIFCPLRQS